MGEIISTFHVDVRLLTAQAVNFAIVFFVLYFFAIKPLMKVLIERSQKIADSLSNAEKIEKELIDTGKKRDEVIKKARQEANKILIEVEAKSEKRKAEMMVKAKAEIEEIVKKTKDDLEIEKQITIKHIKAETGELIVVSLEKIIESKLDGATDKAYIDKVIKEIKS